MAQLTRSKGINRLCSVDSANLQSQFQAAKWVFRLGFSASTRKGKLFPEIQGKLAMFDAAHYGEFSKHD
jgi:hypothetical protein